MTNRENILISLEADLRAIKRPAYKTDVRCVEPFVRSECVGKGLRPWVGFAPATAPVPVPEHFNSSQCFMQELYVVTQLFVGEYPGKSKRRCLNELIDDVIGAVYGNVRRVLPNETTPNAKNTRLFNGPITDEMDPEWVSNGVGEAILIWRIEYNRSTTHESPSA